MPQNTAMQSLLIHSRQDDYQVHFIGDLKDIIDRLLSIPRSVLLIDRSVAELYKHELDLLLSSIPTLMLSASEEEKTLVGVQKILNFFQHCNCNKQSNIIAVGGGIIQDLTAFSCHLYYRGLKWFFVPTTLLSMTDSCIGAKSGINFNAFKNQLGAFHAPAEIFIYHQFINTLSDLDVQSGYGEILKLCLTGSPNLFRQLEISLDDAKCFRKADVAELIYESLKIKKEIIEIDEYETDLRRILNYGHTFGHSLETVTQYEIPHGTAVAWGIDLVNYISLRLGLLNRETYTQIHEFIEKHFIFSCANKISVDEVINAAKRDKKVTKNFLNLAILEKIGKITIIPVAFDSLLTEAVEEYMEISSVISVR
jgi:3-dehydroquinate synthase